MNALEFLGLVFLFLIVVFALAWSCGYVEISDGGDQ